MRQLSLYLQMYEIHYHTLVPELTTILKKIDDISHAYCFFTKPYQRNPSMSLSLVWKTHATKSVTYGWTDNYTIGLADTKESLSRSGCI